MHRRHATALLRSLFTGAQPSDASTAFDALHGVSGRRRWFVYALRENLRRYEVFIALPRSAPWYDDDALTSASIVSCRRLIACLVCSALFNMARASRRKSKFVIRDRFREKTPNGSPGSFYLNYVKSLVERNRSDVYIFK